MKTFDAVIVGSGPTGGYAAKALAGAGMRVLVLDAGPTRLHNHAVHSYDTMRRRLGYRIEEDPAAIRRQPVQSSCYAWPGHPHGFVDDVDNPYTTGSGQEGVIAGGTPFAWIRSRQLGGRMAVRGHGLQFYRFSDLEFKCGDRDEASPSWPISYADLAPYYDRIERWMRLRGARDGIAHLPDPVLACETALNPAERMLKSAIARRWKDRRLIACRTAAAPLPILEAMSTGRCSVRSNAIVSHIVVDPHAPTRARGVSFIDGATGRVREVAARIVVLCASSIESARLLLSSATREHPEGIANSSGSVGRYLMDHTHLTGIAADMPIPEADQTIGRSWTYIPRFRNVCGQQAPFLRGYGVQVFTLGSLCGMTAFGEMLPHADNRVTLDPQVKDKWGVPVPRITCVHRENELGMVRDQVDSCLEMLDAAGFTPWRTGRDLSLPGIANHEMGTARMGDDSKSSVLNSFCQTWDVNNLFVMDGSCFVSQGVQNPTLTMLAIAARSCDFLVDEYRRGNL